MNTSEARADGYDLRWSKKGYGRANNRGARWKRDEEREGGRGEVMREGCRGLGNDKQIV